MATFHIFLTLVIVVASLVINHASVRLPEWPGISLKGYNGNVAKNFKNSHISLLSGTRVKQRKDFQNSLVTVKYRFYHPLIDALVEKASWSWKIRGFHNDAQQLGPLHTQDDINCNIQVWLHYVGMQSSQA